MMKAAGRMGWSSNDFWYSTPSFFYAALAGYSEGEIDRINFGFAHARLIAYYASAPHLGKEAVEMRDIYPLPWDKEREAKFPEVTEDELRKFNDAADRAYKITNQNVNGSAT